MKRTVFTIVVAAAVLELIAMVAMSGLVEGEYSWLVGTVVWSLAVCAGAIVWLKHSRNNG